MKEYNPATVRPQIGQLLPQVSSPLARRVVLYLFNHPWTYLSPDDDYSSSILAKPTKRAYYLRIEAKLTHSSLHLTIPAGLDLLPDFYATIPPLLSLWLKKFKPKSYEELIEHLINHLDWYLSPQAQLNKKILWRLYGSIAGFLLLCLGLVIWSVVTTSYLPFMFGLILVFQLPAIIRFNIERIVRSTDAATLGINATLLYRYLRDAYADDLGGAKLAETSQLPVAYSFGRADRRVSH